MNSDDVARARAAVTTTANALELATGTTTVVHNSNKLSLRLLPCDVFARVSPPNQHGEAAREVALAQQLIAAAAPVAELAVGLDPIVYRCDGFAVTFWTYYEAPALLEPAAYAHALERFHEGMRIVDVAAPHMTSRIDEALTLVANHDQTPQLAKEGRELLLNTLTRLRQRIVHSGAVEQLIHGEPHPGNALNTTSGPRFIDLETCCRGPVEFDLAHVPVDVAAQYDGVDHELIEECRRLVLAMVAAWRWDVHDEFPDGLRHGRAIVDLLGKGPPWPTIGELSEH